MAGSGENIIDFMEIMYDKDFTAKTLSTILLNECNKLYGYEPGDDTTVCTVKLRRAQPDESHDWSPG